MIDGIPNRPLYFYQKDIIAGTGGKVEHMTRITWVREIIPFYGPTIQVSELL